MTILYRIEVLGRAGTGKTTRAREIFETRKELNLSTSLVDDDKHIAVHYGKPGRRHVTIETRIADCDLTEIRFTK